MTKEHGNCNFMVDLHGFSEQQWDTILELQGVGSK
jgi:hypothetical protein